MFRRKLLTVITLPLGEKKSCFRAPNARVTFTGYVRVVLIHINTRRRGEGKTSVCHVCITLAVVRLRDFQHPPFCIGQGVGGCIRKEQEG